MQTGLIDEAVREVIIDEDTQMIRLFGRTGVCLDKLRPDTIERVINKII